MFFIRTGKVIAYLILGISLANIALGLFIIFGPSDLETKTALANRYVGKGLESVGRSLDRSLWGVLIAVVLGVFCEVGARLVRSKQQG